MAPKQIYDLLDHTYGPYRENMILNPDFPRPGVKLVMNHLEMNFEGESTMTGFDHTEYITTPPEGSKIARNPDVVFFGTIEIEDLDWLSDQGLKLLERDFEDYDRQIHMEHLLTNVPIKRYYSSMSGRSDWLPLRVKICCRKTLLAHYMTSKNDFEKLLVYSEYEQKKRTYHVQTLHAATLESSLKFMARYRLRAMITELIETDPDHTPLDERTVDWVVRRYFEDIRPRDKDLQLYQEPGHHYAPRHLRHISRAEIRGYLAEHAEWLLGHMIARKQGLSNLLDIPQWMSFCKEARRDSIEAAKKGVKWGSSSEPVDGDGPYNLAQRLARFGETEQFWGNQLKQIQRRRSTLTTAKPRDLSPEGAQPEDTAQKISFQYDSDFSEASSASYSEESEESDSDPSAETPRFCFEAPHLPTGRFVWNCSGCSYNINLFNLSQENLQSLPDDTIRVLVSKAWRVCDKPIQRALFCMVSNHYEVQHLNQQGLQVIQKSAKAWTVRRPKPLQSHSRMESTPSIKIEESSGGPVGCLDFGTDGCLDFGTEVQTD